MGQKNVLLQLQAYTTCRCNNQLKTSLHKPFSLYAVCHSTVIWGLLSALFFGLLGQSELPASLKAWSGNPDKYNNPDNPR